jgi:hypothetical protein
MFSSWMTLIFDAARLGWEAQNVVALRLSRLAAGRVGPTEAKLMIIEKIAAATEAQIVATRFALEGGSGHTAAAKIINLYTMRVRGNKRRLARNAD